MNRCARVLTSLIVIGAIVAIALLAAFFAYNAPRGDGATDEAAPQPTALPDARSPSRIPTSGPPRRDFLAPFAPWPPPLPSEQMSLPRGLLFRHGSQPSLAAVAQRLVVVLDGAGYPEYRFYSVPGGFALVVRLEQFESDGRPGPEADRFVYPDVDQPFRLSDYVAQLFFAPDGYYRLIVFVVTDRDIRPGAPAPRLVAAERWLEMGSSRLPDDYDRMMFTPKHQLAALIYEFHKHGREPIATLEPGRLDARTHLRKSGLYATLVHGP